MGLIKPKLKGVGAQVHREIEPDNAHVIVLGVESHHIEIFDGQLELMVAAQQNVDVWLRGLLQGQHQHETCNACKWQHPT